MKKNSQLDISPMLCAKCEFDCDMIINKCLRFYDLKSNERYIFCEL